MRPARRLLGLAALAALGAGVLGIGGAVVAAGQQEGPPRDAAPADPIGDFLRSQPPIESAPAADPAPAAPIAVLPPSPLEQAAPVEEMIEEAESVPVAEKIEEPELPQERQRRRIAVVEAIDKITTERMRFEVEVGGRPVRFNDSLIFTARACEVSAPSEPIADSIAYLDISLQPRGAGGGEPRQLFRGWMFASTPAVSGLQHSIYDAWVVGCKA